MLRRPARPALRRTGIGRILERGLDRCREFFGRGGDAHQVADRDYLRQWRGHDRQAGRHVLVELDRVDALDQRRDLEGNDADRKIPYRFGEFVVGNLAGQFDIAQAVQRRDDFGFGAADQLEADRRVVLGGGPDPRRFEPMVDGAEVPDNRLIFAAALAPRATEVLDRCAIADQRARPDRRYPVGQWLGGGDQEIGAADQALLIRQRLLANILEAAQQIEAVVNYGAAW